MNVYIYAKLQNFIQFSPTVTKLCHIKHDRLVSFYISLENCEKLRYLQQYDRSLQNLTRWCRTYRWSASLLVSISKNPTRRTVDTPERPVNCIIMRYREFSIFNPWRVMITIHKPAKISSSSSWHKRVVQKSTKKVGIDGRTRPITLPFSLTRSVAGWLKMQDVKDQEIGNYRTKNVFSRTAFYAPPR